MTHPILVLQGALVAALRDDPDLTVFDAPPAGRKPPYVTIARHDLLPRDGDEAAGYEHKLILHAWAADASRKAAVALAEKVVDIAASAELDSATLKVTLRRHDRTDTSIDQNSGRAKAAIALTFYSEPSST